MKTIVRTGAADPCPTAAVIPPNVLVHVLNHADRRGDDTRPWFSGLGLTREQLLEPRVKVSYHQARTVLRRALEAFDEPGAGLLVGREETLGSFGLLGLLMMTSETFGEAVRLGTQNHKVSGSLMDMRLEPLPQDQMALEMWPRFDDPELLPFLCEEIIASSLMLARELLGPEFTLRRVELTYAAPAHAPMYASIIGLAPRFGALRNRAVVDAFWLNKRLPGHNALAAHQALELCQMQLAQTRDADQELVSAVKQLLRRHLQRAPHIAEVARELNLSERSLRRRLAVAGRSFREIHDEVRIDHAVTLLRASALPVTAVAEAIGFSDAREFRRAFKRWTGVPPQAVRQGRVCAHIDRFAPAGEKL
jgi:AraC-like DNA-binding protein